jgi:ribose transport system permease protein
VGGHSTRSQTRSISPAPEKNRGSTRRWSRPSLSQYGSVIFLVGLVVLFSLLRSNFATTSNTLTILDQSSVLAIMAGGLTICLVLNEFDLSIGYAATLSGVLATHWLASGDISLWPSILIALVAGVAVGIVNGTIVAYWRVNAFIATLGTGSVLQGVILWITGGSAAVVSNSTLLAIGQSKAFGIPVPVIIAAVVLIILWVGLNKTEAGRRMDAIGGNAAAARLSGLHVERYRLLGFVVCSVCAAISGVVLAGELGAGYSDAAVSLLLQAFTACFIGAATLRSGEFHILGTAIGVLLLSVAFNGLTQLGVATFWQNIAQGLILVAAMATASLSGRLRVRPTRRSAARRRCRDVTAEASPDAQ